VWYKNMQMDGEGRFAPHLIEEVYNSGRCAGGGRLLEQLYPARRRWFKIANIAQIVNIIAPILTRGDEC